MMILKYIKAMKESYLPELSEMKQKIATKIQQVLFVRQIFNSFYG
jgi:hypothetical protein